MTASPPDDDGALPQQSTRPSPRGVATWLLVCCAMVFVMVVLGALTRLTHSGLSMVQWRPITGILPPMTDAAWQHAFAQYKSSPEFQRINVQMDLSGYKSIFYLEYIHRLWGRLIGLAFFVPMVVFVACRRLPAGLAPKLVALFGLGGLQGCLGWYMVQSGLVDRPDVSQYRLTAHLGAAFLLYGYMLWLALSLLQPRACIIPAGEAALRRSSLVALSLVFLTVLAGGLVAGLDAGFVFNDFPWMGGKLVPDGLLALQPVLTNVGENVITVQFQHRVLALTTAAWVGVTCWQARRARLSAARMRPFYAALGIVVVQLSLGIATLMLYVPTWLATLHQATGLLLFSTAIWTTHSAHGGVRAQPAHIPRDVVPMRLAS